MIDYQYIFTTTYYFPKIDLSKKGKSDIVKSEKVKIDKSLLRFVDFWLWAIKKIFSVVLRMNSNSYITVRF